MSLRFALAACFACAWSGIAAADPPPPPPPPPPSSSPPPARSTRIEVGFLAGGERSDGYTDTLSKFGYTRGSNTTLGFQVTALHQVVRTLWLGGRAGMQFLPDYSESILGAPNVPPQDFRWRATLFDAVARWDIPFGDSGVGLYLQGAAGLGIGQSSVKGEDQTSHNVHYGPSLATGTGLYVEERWLGLGFAIGYEYEYAPVIQNLVGDTHSVGGNRFTFALTERF